MDNDPGRVKDQAKGLDRSKIDRRAAIKKALLGAAATGVFAPSVKAFAQSSSSLTPDPRLYVSLCDSAEEWCNYLVTKIVQNVSGYCGVLDVNVDDIICLQCPVRAGDNCPSPTQINILAIWPAIGKCVVKVQTMQTVCTICQSAAKVQLCLR